MSVRQGENLGRGDGRRRPVAVDDVQQRFLGARPAQCLVHGRGSVGARHTDQDRPQQADESREFTGQTASYFRDLVRRGVQGVRERVVVYLHQVVRRGVAQVPLHLHERQLERVTQPRPTQELGEGGGAGL